MDNDNQSTGVSFPPLNSGSSWNVPRVSLPGLFAVQPEFHTEWWYYVGTVFTTTGKKISVQIQITRATVVPDFSIACSVAGIGWKDEHEESNYIFGQGFGLGASEQSAWLSIPNALVVPLVTDNAFSATMTPLIEIIGQSKNLLDDVKLDILSSHQCKLEYLGGSNIGSIDSEYSIAVKGTGYKTTANSSSTIETDYMVSLKAKDKRGAVMEGVSGYVGPDMFPSGTNSGAPASYECAQPFLNVTGGTIEIDGQLHTVEKGNLWMDRQMVAASNNNSTEQSDAPKDAEELKNLIATKATAHKSLYLGDWMAVTLNNEVNLALAVFWNPSNPQWITGTKVKHPPKDGFGNMFFKIDNYSTPIHNGGMALKPRLSLTDEDWDFDINILNPEKPIESPHWKSPISLQTYATAWEIEFSKRIQQYGLPDKLFVFALCENCENVLPGKINSFFEGAALAYADKEKTRPLGHVFVEQMGFN